MALTPFTLVHPHSQYELSYREALAEYQSEGRDPVHTDLIDTQGFAAYITALRAIEDPAQVPQEFVPSTTWWLVGGEAYHGRLSMRHELNANLLQFGGHIGYDLRRDRGWAPCSSVWVWRKRARLACDACCSPAITTTHGPRE